MVVKSRKEGGSLEEIMPIGHSKRSTTFMPQIESGPKGVIYCDCPGFLDNRGKEINIANAVNIVGFPFIQQGKDYRVDKLSQFAS